MDYQSTNIDLFITIDALGVITLNVQEGSGAVTVSGPVTAGHCGYILQSIIYSRRWSIRNAAFKAHPVLPNLIWLRFAGQFLLEISPLTVILQALLILVWILARFN